MASSVPKKPGVTAAPTCREVTTVTAATIRKGSQEISIMADAMLAAGFRTEANMLLEAAATCATVASNIERKIDAYRQAVNNLD